MYRYFLDNTLIDEPQGWDDLVETNKRDSTVKGLLRVIDVILTFKGSGYSYIKSVRDIGGFCSEIDIRIEKQVSDQWSYLYEGKIFVSDVQEYEFKKEIKARIVDNSYYARIWNNRDIGMIPTTSVAKDLDTSITPITIQDTGLFAPSTGLKVGVQCRTIKMYDAFDIIVRWMSDGELGFESDFFSTGDFANLMLTSGYAIREAGDSNVLTDTEFAKHLPSISFSTLFEAIDKQFNVYFAIDRTVSPNVLRLEPESYFKTSDTIISLSDIEEVLTKVSVEKLYSVVKFGSAETMNAGSLEFPETIRFVGFNNEEYYTLGQCNIDTVKDLENPLSYSSNMIEYLLENPTDLSYDENWFLLETNTDGLLSSGFTYEANFSNWVGISSAVFYNENLTNKKVAERYIGGIPSSIASTLGVRDDSFKAISSTSSSQAVASTTYEPLAFQTEIFDANANYDNATYEYICPVAGVYAFSVTLPIYYANLVPGNGATTGTANSIKVYLNIYDSGGFAGGALARPELKIFEKSPNNHPYWSVYTVNASGSANMDVGDVAVIKVILEGNDNVSTFGVGTGISITSGASFSCYASSVGGGIYHEYDPENYPIYEHSFKYPLTDAQHETIKTDITGLIDFAVNGEQYKKGWVSEMKYNKKSQIAEFKLISSKILNQ